MRFRKIQTFAFLLTACLGLVGRTIYLSSRQPMWLDEVFTYYGLDQTSFADFWRSLHTAGNAAPPGYFLLMWGLEKIVPLSPLMLRLFSTVCSAGAFVLIWTTLRRHTSFMVAAVATGTLMLTSDLFLTHNSEARYYGPYLLAVAWAVFNFELLCTQEPTKGRLVLNTLSHAAAVSVMYVAGLYCFGIFVALITRDRLLKLWRPKVYLSVLAGWIPVIFYLPFLKAQKSAPIFNPKVGILAIFHPFEAGINTNACYFVLIAMAVLLFLAWQRRNVPVAPTNDGEFPLHLALLTVVFLCVPYAILALSVSGVVPVLQLLPRYCLPSLLGLVLLFGLIGRMVQNGLGMTESLTGHYRLAEKFAAFALLAGLVSWPVIDALVWARGPARDERLHYEANVDPPFLQDVPVIATCDPHTYFVRSFMSGENPKLIYVVASPDDYNMLRRYQKRLNPILLDDFLLKYSRFGVVSDDPQREWLEAAALKHGDFVVEREQQNARHKWLIVDRKPQTRLSHVTPSGANPPL